MSTDLQARQLANNLPLASQLLLLEQALSLPEGSKVRFLGCVYSHDIANATLVLKTPRHSLSARRKPRLAVSIANILGSLDRDSVQIGAWINVIGYVQRGIHSKVEATNIWDAGAVRFDEYVAAVKERMDQTTDLATVTRRFI
ncbi:hypothetical protein K431DRAFT_287378 [Polychaeton citri CBS 116435]|uniref:CST complex subunit Ten1 n=1 Tax=Polychaeton citri CBS 116435 TaxID=1314669 RepID=A0A9P4Q3B9_9PEZI|nr:hypothetical protein K431DRAFT_287378 [Polychaeton citri CBS 116435]